MRKNNIIKIGAIALLSCFALTACSDDIIAKPTGYDENSPFMVVPEGEEEVYDNNLTAIYDSIREGNLASEVLDQLLYQYSVSVFGNYNRVTAATLSKNFKEDGNQDNKFGNTTLKQAYAGITTDATSGKLVGTATTNDFIKAHTAYWSKDKNGKRVDDLNQPIGDNEAEANPSQSEYTRLKMRWESIEKRIAKKLYSAISGGSYSDRSVFEELEYLRSLQSSVDNKVSIPVKENKEVDTDKLFKGILTSKVEDYQVFSVTTENINGTEDYILHREYYQSSCKDANDTATTDETATYVEDKLIPDIYRQLLVEQYVLDESYDTLGRTSARQVDVLSIAKNSNYSKGAANLMDEFVKNTIFKHDRKKAITLDDFKVVSDAWVGAFMSKADYATNEKTKPMYDLLKAAVPGYEAKTSDNKPYFQGTAYGDMMEEYDKISNNPRTSENEGTFTNDGAYTKEIGLTIKTRELELQDHTTTGWYVKSVGVDGLPDSIKSQLFDINVANAIGIKGEGCVEYKYNNADSKWEITEKDANGNKLINVLGKVVVDDTTVPASYFLRNTSRVAGTPIQNDILFEDGNNYYIVLVNEAIRSNDLNKANYAKKEGQKDDDFLNELLNLENYVNEIVQIVGNTDTNQTLSKKHWLEKMELKYHDTVVYDYFKTNFPELFEDD